MSCNRENVVWKSRDGTWNRAFFDFYQTGEDHEWDVEYDMTRFNWVSTGHTTENEALASWGGANPGGYSSYDTPDAQTDAFDAMAAARLEEQRKIDLQIAQQRRQPLLPWR